MTKTPVQMAVEALECYIEHNEPNDCPCAVMWPHRDAILDALKASLLPQPPSPGSVAEAVDGGELKAGIKYAEQQRDLYRENSRHWKEWQTLIAAAQQRPEVVTVEEFLKVAWSHVTYDHKPIEAIRQAAEDVQKRFPHGLIIKSTERFR